MALADYRAKRNFSSTPEPQGEPGDETGSSFVIQKHAATRLHYDFRLELDGVLKSWAVTKGPSLVAGEKRLAVHVEDHPLAYADFEGTIPKGQYGGGDVIIWDRGRWTARGDARHGYEKGHLEFELQGEKLQGVWHLVRMHGKPGEKRENWLLIKSEDDFARPPGSADILEEKPDSVMSGNGLPETKGSTGARRGNGAPKPKPVIQPRATSKEEHAGTEIIPAPDAAKVRGVRTSALPNFVDPMLATLVAKAPSGADWLHEIKFDGYRLQARIEAGRVRLLTRGGLDWTKKFGKTVLSALQNLPVGTATIDGEIVVETAAGASDFSALQADLSEGRVERFVFYAFDILHLDGYDLTGVTLVERKAVLEALVGQAEDALRFSRNFDDSGALVLQHACRLSLEGIVSKRRESKYRAGRGKAWVKSKCSARQEFVVAGYVPSTVSRKAIGSLVLGVYDGTSLQHVGRVGTGFTATVAADLFRKLDRLRVATSPFEQPLDADEARQVRYVTPDLVAEIEFRAWTADGHLRHASFRGLREDKAARDIIRETASMPKKSPAPPQRRTIRLTHPDRLYWPQDGVTKEGLADYYTEIWRYIAPFVVGRPLALLRCPSGLEGEKFFQKHAWKGLDPHIALVQDPADPGDDALISINDLDGLLALVQSAVLEIHPWGSTVTDWDRPDTLVMDLDPGDDVAWTAIISAAEEVRQRLADAGLGAFVKTSGGKGLHVAAPLQPKADWPAVKSFTKAMAEAMAADSPDRFVATVTKSKRHGKILIDYLRNQRGATAVAAYSTRARPGAAVSAPLRWDELGPAIGPAFFTVENMPQRLASLSADPWENFRSAAVPLVARRSGR